MPEIIKVSNGKIQREVRLITPEVISNIQHECIHRFGYYHVVNGTMKPKNGNWHSKNKGQWRYSYQKNYKNQKLYQNMAIN